MKKIINDRARIVDDMLDGYVAGHADRVARAANARVVVRAQPKSTGKVGLVIGNGSGHEPIAMGWVGEGLLDANAVGDIFAAPPPGLILDGIKAADRGAGVILLISQHAGDVMNGEAAIELARDESIPAKALLMYDDISSAPKGEESERRGAPGTTFVYKIVGAAAEDRRGLESLMGLGAHVRDNTRTLAAAVAPGISPLTGEPMFELPPDEVYVGMGVHGEPGLSRRPIEPARDLVGAMMAAIIDDLPFQGGDEVIPLVNGSGGTTLMELLIIYREVAAVLSERRIKTFKPLIAELVTTQEAAGFSISLLRADDDMKRLWVAPCSAPYFHM